MQKVGIIGSGQVAVALAKGFLKYGYETMISSRSPEKAGDLKSQLGTDLKTGNFKDAAAFGNIVVLAVAGHAAKSALDIIGADSLRGKTVIDATNPISGGPDGNGYFPISPT